MHEIDLLSKKYGSTVFIWGLCLALVNELEVKLVSFDKKMLSAEKSVPTVHKEQPLEKTLIYERQGVRQLNAATTTPDEIALLIGRC